MSDPFASAQDLAQLIGQPLPDDLARPQQFLSFASALIRGFTGQTLSTVAGDVVVLQPVYSTNLYLPQRPVTAVTTVTVKAVPITDYTAYLQAGWLYREVGWADGATVTYDHGYAEGSTDYQEIKSICLEIASRAYTMNERGQSEVLGGVTGATVLESAGYAPENFLTAQERARLGKFGGVSVG